ISLQFNLEKRLSDAELPIAGLFLWALAHGLELLLIDGEVVPDEYRKDIVHRVLQLAGTGLDGARA
ncbi:TetR family transcriptional regulator, partial [Bradyrhizobium sp. Leo121]